jgi:hypothetical protein
MFRSRAGVSPGAASGRGAKGLFMRGETVGPQDGSYIDVTPLTTQNRQPKGRTGYQRHLYRPLRVKSSGLRTAG